MSGIGFSELIILALIGLIVLGPERLPRVANQLGSWLGQARRMTRVMKRQLEDELNIEKEFDIKSPPVSREPSTQPKVAPTPPPRDDDDYSPAHAADDVGTGVRDSEVHDRDDNPAATNAEPAADAEQDIDAAVADKADAKKVS
jgi:sec-independent protein translocase protein TatB